MKICPKCKNNKELSEFSRNKSRKNGYNSLCKLCAKYYKDKHYQNNKTYYSNKNKQQKKSNTEFLKLFKNNSKCENCGEKHIACLDFHHKEDFKKDYNVSKMKGFSKKSILKEIDKCIILCSNCHRKLHFDISTNIV